ncbi:MAG TPA: hypothetical protein VMH80_25385 [Bryobacteraceae bacterium]|nr:hypothetical protein [Bryobacteraceae bacterium]
MLARWTSNRDGPRSTIDLTSPGEPQHVAGSAVSSGFSRLLYGVRPDDPLTLPAVSLCLVAAALLACYIPARRAAVLGPMAALRHE